VDKIQLTNDVWIGKDQPPIVVAEIGLNHNGKLDTALEMIKKAKDIGVNAVKFQVKDVEEAHPKEMLDMPYEGPNSFGKTYREHKQALEFSQNELEQIYDYAKKMNIICFSTPCNVNAVKRLEQLNNPIYKMSMNLRNRLNEFLNIKRLTNTNKTFDMVGCTPTELKAYLEKKFSPGMTWWNHSPKGWHIDHIIPLSRAKNYEDIVKLMHYKNLQPMWAEDNLKKGDKY